MHASIRVPFVSLRRSLNICELSGARALVAQPPGWAAIFVKAFALVAKEEPVLRTLYVKWPSPAFYELPRSVAMVAIARVEDGQDCVLPQKVTAPDEVTVGDRVFRARRGIVLSAGTAPAIPPIEGLAGTPYWTNHEAVETKKVPASLVVLGGGAVGVELAQVFARFGSKVTIVERSPGLLPPEEPEAGELIAGVFGREGIDVRTGVGAQSVARAAEGVEVTLDRGGPLRGERLLVATGRRTDLHPLGVASVGLDADAHAIPVDDRLRAADRLWAIGDVTGLGPFTHIAVYQARIAAADILGEDAPPADYRALPRVTFTDPEIGAVGLTERQAREQGIDVRVGIADLRTSSRGWIHKVGNEGFFKLVEDRRRGVLVGATSVGPHGGETLGLIALAVYAEVPVERLRWMIYAYPTFHRGIEDALADLRAG